MLEYKITANVVPSGIAKAKANQSQVSFDATSGRDTVLPNPAELLLTSLAACILKNVQRYSEILKIQYRSAKLTIHGKRKDNPPIIFEINYSLEIDTDVSQRKLDIWHKNIIKFGTITNTISKACKVNGTITKFKSSAL